MTRIGSAAAGGIALAVFLAGASPDARAGACPSAQIRVSPEGGATAPTNVLVRLAFEAAEVTVHELLDDRSRQILKTGHVRASEVDVELRTEVGATVPVTIRRPPSTYKPLILVAPRRPLAPRTRHVVVVRTRTERFVVARFVTGDGVDTVAPVLGPVARARYGRYPEGRDWKDETGTWATVILASATDAVAFEVHALPEGQTATDATLRTLVPPGPGRSLTLRLHDGGPCSWANFHFPRVPPGVRSYPLRLGLRAVDAAGNPSAVREVTLDLARPERSRR